MLLGLDGRVSAGESLGDTVAEECSENDSKVVLSEEVGADPHIGDEGVEDTGVTVDDDGVDGVGVVGVGDSVAVGTDNKSWLLIATALATSD